MRKSESVHSPEISSIDTSATPAGSANRTVVNSTTVGFILAALQFALVVLLLKRFNLESLAFQDVAQIACAGFLVHHFLPAQWRLSFFLLLSVGATTYILGLEQQHWLLGLSLSRAVPLFAIGLVLIGICHLPARLGVRVTLLVIAGGILAWVRSQWSAWTGGGVDAAWIWPILGSMFMFRLIIYVYDLQHEKGPVQPVRALAYFFLLPNVCFTLFPVIDYKTFCRNYFNEPALRIYQRGLGWMTRGIIHILLWRIVYYEFYIGPSQVGSGEDIVRYVTTNMAMYLHVSGQFHLAIGLLLLFGFNLPETNHRFYFFAASFSDLWRRVNIYWMNFMMKIFYYPAVFRFKALGTNRSMVVATVFVFFVTWVLHSYQTFWVRNSFPIHSQDLIFWGCLGALVIHASLREMKKGRKRSLGESKVSWREKLSLGWRTTVTLFILSTLWSLWSCDSLEQWLGLWKLADGHTLLWGAAALTVIFVTTVIVEGSPRTPAAAIAAGSNGRNVDGTRAANPIRQALWTCVVPAALLLLISVQRFHVYLGPDARDFVSSLFETKPNKSDEENMVRGYYENLMEVEANPIIEAAGARKPKDWGMLENTNAYREVGDYRLYELAPSTHIVLNGKSLTTNRWGMRDREYELVKAAGTYRIAVLGSSVTMGLNVADGETFEALVEERLNRERAGRPYAHYEILNFAVNGYNPPSEAVVLEKKVLDFKPDAVLLVNHPQDAYFTVQRFAKSLRRGIEPIDEVFRQVARDAKVDARTPELVAEKRLAPYWPQLTEWAYALITERCRREGIKAIMVYLPGVGDKVHNKDGDQMLALARKAGFTIINLENPYGNTSPDSVKVAPWDAHPNALGHKLIADGLYAALTAETGSLFSPSGVAAGKPEKKSNEKKEPKP